MVKKVQTVCLDPAFPCARQYEREEAALREQVTVPDMAPSLQKMVLTGSVGTMPGNSSLYQYPTLGSDEEAHDHPDYSKLNNMDMVEKENFATQWLDNAEQLKQKEDELESARAADAAQKQEPTAAVGSDNAPATK